MDISEAYSEPLARFLAFHDDFNIQFKAAVTALAYFSDEGRNVEFLNQMEKRWRDGHNWTKANTILRQAGEDACRMGIVRIHSAFEDYVVGAEAEHTRWRDFSSNGGSDRRGSKSRQRQTEAKIDDDAKYAQRMCARTGLSATELETCEPVLRYFRAVRNCVAHRTARVSSELEEASTSPLLAKLIKTWPKRKGAKPPPIAVYRVGKSIAVHPKAAILYLDAVRRCCNAIDRSLVGFLGPAGLAYCAAHHLFFDENRETLEVAYRKPNRGMNHVLTSRYNVIAPRNRPMEELQRLGVWEKCRRRHARLYQHSVDTGLFKPPHGFGGLP
jgi:hypothetical protein